MPHESSLILTLMGGLTSALVLGLITQRLRLSPIVGYLLAGVIVGPFTPGFVADAHIAEQFAELGVILLMFGVGLHFHLADLLAVRKIAIPGAIAQIAVATALGVLLTWAFDWSLAAGLVFGLAISVASTVVLLRVLSDNGLLHTAGGHVAVGWLIVEDLFTVLVLVLLPVLSGQHAGGSGRDVAIAVGIAVLQIAGLCVFTLFVGQKLIVRLLNAVAQTRSRELFTLSVLVLALGIAVGAAVLFGASMALGAFLAGMVVGQSNFSARAASEALPMRDAFAVLFFVSVGMLLDPGALLEHPGLVAGAIGIVLVGKSAAAFAMVRLLRYPVATALLIALALAQIGEFSFILARLGHDLEILPAAANNVLVATSVVSITLNPLLFRLLAPLTRRLATHPSVPPEADRLSRLTASGRAVVVGYGHVGQTVSKLLREHQIEPTIVELNHNTVASLRDSGIAAVYGDATQAGVLEAAGVASAGSLIFAASGTPPQEVIETARIINPNLEILARSNYLSEARLSRQAGADIVVSAEAEVAFAMAEHLLRRLGATPDQIDRARDELRAGQS
ncbi:MAG TPA: cation:proton antiporter [Polyangiaceae bacterium]|nr:cation:proton antiporter [Polyangiaceae bacterium]